jgi:tRNA (mo5U34)-methyltransferase
MNTAGIDGLRQQVDSLEWYHTIDLGHGIVTPGHYDHRPYLDFYGLSKDLSGKTVLDIGTASGFFAFEMERRGAKVTATDLPEWMAHDFGPNYRSEKTLEEAHSYMHDPFALAKHVLESKVEKREINIYDISPQTIGTFDLVFCSSVLLHLTDPIKALWRIQSVTKESAIIATAIWQEAGDIEPLAAFAGHRGTAWWIPNHAALEAMVQTAGFASWEWISEFRLDFRDGRPGLHHGVIRAWNTEGHPPSTSKQSPGNTSQTQDSPTRLKLELVKRDAEIAHLKEMVAGYERGRFIRLMRHINKWRRKILGG